MEGKIDENVVTLVHAPADSLYAEVRWSGRCRWNRPLRHFEKATQGLIDEFPIEQVLPRLAVHPEAQILKDALAQRHDILDFFETDVIADPSEPSGS